MVALSKNFYEFVNHDSERRVSPCLSLITFVNCAREKVLTILHTITKNCSWISRSSRVRGRFPPFFLRFPQKKNIVLTVLVGYIYKERSIDTVYVLIHNLNRTIIVRYLYRIKTKQKYGLLKTLHSKNTGLRNRKLWQIVWIIIYHREFNVWKTKS